MVGAPTEGEDAEDSDAKTDGDVAPDHVAVTAAEYNAVAIEQDWTVISKPIPGLISIRK